MVTLNQSAGRRPVKRFTVSLDASDYDRLRDLARRHRPPLSLQYVAEYAIQLLLKSAEEDDFADRLGNPLSND